MKYAKVRCLALLADPNTAEPVIAELGEYAGDIDPELARQAIRAVGSICLRLPGSAAAAIERLIDLMGMDVRIAAWAGGAVALGRRRRFRFLFLVLFFRFFVLTCHKNADRRSRSMQL